MVELFELRLLLGKHDLWERASGAGGCKRVISVYDSCQTVPWVYSHLEEVQEITSPPSATGSICTDYSDMVWMATDKALAEAGTGVLGLGHVDIPDRAWVVLAGSRRCIVDEVDDSSRGGQPWEDRGGSW